MAVITPTTPSAADEAATRRATEEQRRIRHSTFRGHAVIARASFSTRAGAGLARHRGRNAHLRGLARERLLERDLHVVAQIGTALGTIAAPAPT